ncbi:MAG: hypothetical protein CMJ78_06180 [Planctomycetaceae bacterium]|nr:hypothetical protein [Planctomycetaceae bacterium]
MNTSPPSNVTWLYLIRHGSTDANERRPYILQGQGVNGSLSSTGQRQASLLGEFLSDFAIDAVYASPMVRAVETAQCVAGHHGHEVQTREELLEVNVGQWEGMAWEKIMQQDPVEYQSFMSDPGQNAYLGGESYIDVYNRCQPVLQQLLLKNVGRSIAVVAHNVVNRVYLAGLLGIDIGKGKGLRQENCCINVIKYRNDETTLITMNSTFHLRDALVPD